MIRPKSPPSSIFCNNIYLRYFKKLNVLSHKYIINISLIQEILEKVWKWNMVCCSYFSPMTNVGELVVNVNRVNVEW